MRLRRHIAVAVLALALGACAEFPDHRGGGGTAAPGGHYTVRRGDTLYSIAWRHNLDYRTVARWNGIAAPYTIYPGDRIRLSRPPGGTVARPGSGRSAEPDTGSGSASGPSSRTEQPETTPAESLVWQWPTKGRVSRAYSSSRSGKRGLELAGEAGQPVRAAAAGRVVYGGDGLRGYGNLVIIKHNSRYLTAYGYNRRLLVEEGAKVESGQRIALMGRGPDNSPALHFELRRDGKPVDPASVLPAR